LFLVSEELKLPTISFEAIEEIIDGWKVEINECGSWWELSARSIVEQVARHQLQEIVPGQPRQFIWPRYIIGREATKRNNTPLSTPS